MALTITQMGRFTSDGTSKTLLLRNGVDFIFVKNRTIAAANQTTAVGVEHYWQRTMPNGSQYLYLKSNAANAANLTQYLTTGGFTLLNSSDNTPGALNNGSTGISAVTNAAPPVATVGSTAGMAPGAIVRFESVAGITQLGGYDATVGYNTFSGTTFSLDYFPALGVGTTGNFRVIPFDIQTYPAVRYITKVATGTTTVVTLSVTHQYKRGMKVRFVVPAEFGMVELDGLVGTIIAVDTTTTTGNSITVDIDSTGFTTFAIPPTGSLPFTLAQVVPAGDNTAYEVDNNLVTSAGAYRNTQFIGIRLAGGANLPGGANGDVMEWFAGTVDRFVVE